MERIGIHRLWKMRLPHRRRVACGRLPPCTIPPSACIHMTTLMMTLYGSTSAKRIPTISKKIALGRQCRAGSEKFRPLNERSTDVGSAIAQPHDP